MKDSTCTVIQYLGQKFPRSVIIRNTKKTTALVLCVCFIYFSGVQPDARDDYFK